MSPACHTVESLKKSPLTVYGLSFAVLAAAVAVRWLLAPVLGEAFTVVTVFGAIAFAVWIGGYRPAVAVTVLGWLAVAWLFLDPRGSIELGSASNLAGLIAYLGASSVIIGIFETTRAAQLRLGRSERELTDFFDNSNIGLHWIGPGGTVLWANQAELDMLGYERDAYVGRHITEFHVDRPVIDDILSRLARSETLRGCSARMRAKDGSVRDVLISSGGMLEDGTTRCITLDVTEQKRAQEAGALLAAVVDSSDDAIISKSLDGVILSWNAGAERLFGYTAAEATGQPVTLIIPLELHDEERSILERLRRGERIAHYETTRVTKAGALIDISLTISPIRNDSGRIIGASKIARDITQRKRTEQARAAAERRLRLVTDSAPVLLANCDAEARFKFVNKPYAERFGLTPDDVVDKHLADVVGAEAYAVLQPYVAAALAGRAIEFETEVPYRSGGTQFMHCAYMPERNTDGVVVGLVAAIINITDRKRAEEGLRVSEERYRRLTQLLPVAVYTCEAPSGRITYYNDHAARLWGRVPAAGDTDERFCGSFKLLLPNGTELPHDACPMAVALREARAFRNEEVVLRRIDGSSITVLVNIDPILDPNGDVVAAINVFHDVSALKVAEQKLREADRRKDEFLATLAHELRNPLAPMRHTLEIFKRVANDGELLQHSFATMERQLEQMVRLIDDLLDVSRITRNRLDIRKGYVDVASVVHHAIDACRPLLEEHDHVLEVDLPDAPIHLRADAVRLAQVFGNLLSNACKYSEPGGIIRVAVARQGHAAVVSVKDSGEGIPPDKLESIFEMFAQVHHTLERSQGGLGIGLTLVKQLVELHGGSVEALSQGPGQGSEFIVRLPIAVESAAAETPAPVRDDATPASRRILIVDDNEDSALSLAMLLSMTGHQTYTAHDGCEAVQAAERFRPEIMLLDIGLPKMNGYDVCRTIRGQPWGEGIVIVALTGWGQEEDRRKSHAAGFDGHLVKPVDQTAIDSLLASAPEMHASEPAN
jgi:PAS domain S-box-containing protein